MNKIIKIILNDDVSLEDADNLVEEISAILDYNMVIGGVEFSEEDLEECNDAENIS